MLRTILIVEDADTAATTLEVALLGIPGVQVERVRDGLRALEYLAPGGGRVVEALVTDLELPFLDGFELIARLRGEPRFAKLPIVVVSGHSDPQAEDRARRLGASAYFSKPWSPVEVQQTVARFLNSS